MPTLTSQEFVARYSDSSRSERAGSRSPFIDLCNMLGVPTLSEAEAEAQDDYTVERRVEWLGGKHRWADVWKWGCFGLELKGPDKDLEKQLLLYKDSLENPPLLIVSDMQTIEVHTNFTNTPKVVRNPGLDEPSAPATAAAAVAALDTRSAAPTRGPSTERPGGARNFR